MQIGSIDFKNVISYSKSFKQISNPYCINTNLKDNFIKNNQINFTSSSKLPKQEIKWIWSEYDNKFKCNRNFTRFPRNINILNGGEAHIKDVASSLCLYSDKDIKEFTKLNSKFLWFSRFDAKKSKQAYDKIMPYIQTERRHLSRMQDKIDELEDIERNGTKDLTDEIIIFNQMFINPLEAEKRGEPAVIPNSIILYGNSPRNTLAMASWILSGSCINSMETKYNSKQPEESLSKLEEMLDRSEELYEKTGKRTVIRLRGFDKYIAGEFSMDDAEKFQELTQDCAQKYHATILLHTKNLPKDFTRQNQLTDDSLNIQINKHKLTKEEKLILSEYKRTLAYYETRAKEAIDKYSYVESGFDIKIEDDNQRTLF